MKSSFLSAELRGSSPAETEIMGLAKRAAEWWLASETFKFPWWGCRYCTRILVRFAYYRGLLVDVSDYFAYYFYILSVISVGQFRRILRIFAPNILVREAYSAEMLHQNYRVWRASSPIDLAHYLNVFYNLTSFLYVPQGGPRAAWRLMFHMLYHHFAFNVTWLHAQSRSMFASWSLLNMASECVLNVAAKRELR